jgi:hypothetical protein
LPHGQKTCSAHSRLGCPRSIPDDLHRWDSTGTRLTKRILLDPTNRNRQGATTYNHTKYRRYNTCRCNLQYFSKHAYHSNIIVIITIIAHPTRTYNTLKLTGQTSYHKTTRQHNNNNYSTYKISSPRSCKRSSQRRQHICHHRQISCSRSIPRPLHN